LVEAISAGCRAVAPRANPEDVQGELESGTGADEWDPEDVERMKQLKKRLGITDNEQLNKHVKEFSLGQLTSYLDITPDNIKAFCDYLESLLEEGEAA
jgi:adenylate cyclase class IV